MEDGHTVHTCTFGRSMTSWRKACDRPLIANLLATYGLWNGVGQVPTIEALLMRVPDPCWRNWVRAARDPYTVPMRLTWSTRSKAADGMSRKGPNASTPALLNQTSIRPNASMALCARALTCASSATSVWSSTTWTPASRQALTVSFNSGCRRAHNARRAPLRAKANAVALPMPLEAPVITTTLSSRRPVILLSTTRPQSGVRHPIRAKIAVVLMPEEFGKALSGAVDPALDRADGSAADHRRFFVTEPFGSDQQHRFPLLVRQLRQSTAQFRKLHAPRLFREGGELGREEVIDILHLALAPAVLGVEQVAHEREDPGLKVGAGLKSVLLLQGAQERVLNQIVRPVSVANKGEGKGAKARRHREKVCTEVSLSLARRRYIPNRRGREWTSDLESGWGVERARGRASGRGRREIRLNHLPCPWNDRWRIRRSLGAELPPCTPARDQRKPSISFGL